MPNNDSNYRAGQHAALEAGVGITTGMALPDALSPALLTLLEDAGLTVSPAIRGRVEGFLGEIGRLLALKAAG